LRDNAPLGDPDTVFGVDVSGAGKAVGSMLKERGPSDSKKLRTDRQKSVTFFASNTLIHIIQMMKCDVSDK
jgi:hypothetical protein